MFWLDSGRRMEDGALVSTFDYVPVKARLFLDRSPAMWLPLTNATIEGL